MITALRFIHLLSLVSWIGMISFFTFFAAPSIFKILPRELAGDVVGDIFPKYWVIGYISSIVAIASLAALGVMEKSLPVARIILLVVMTSVTFYSGLVVAKEAVRIKAESRVAENQAKKDELRGAFKKVHAVSASLNIFVFILGLVVLFLTSRGMTIIPGRFG